jgi:hypothetical protein
LHLAYAVPDHPWVDSADGAAVRIAMTVAAPGQGHGLLQTVTQEGGADGDAVHVELAGKIGRIHADLSIGADVVNAQALRANNGISSPGFKLHGAGFIVTPDEAARLLPSPNPLPASGARALPPSPHEMGRGAGGEGQKAGAEGTPVIRPYRNGRDLTDRPRGVQVIDLYGLSADETRQRYPAVYQWVMERVKPERDAKAHSPDGAAYARLWWLHGKPRPELRKALAGLHRYIATVETAKHRTFQFLDASIAPDNMLVCIALADAFHLGVLSSRVHVTWALAAGGRLGMGNDPRYNKTRCFDPFPFPAATPDQQARIRALAEELDGHRKRVLSPRPAERGEGPGARGDLTLTGLYNVLEKLRTGEPLTAKDKAIHEQGLVSVLKQLHDELDAAVLDAYGWSDLLPPPNPLPASGARASLPSPHPVGRGAGGEGRKAGGAGPFDTDVLLERLVALNAERRREEAAGHIRWLRPDFQNPEARTATADADAPAASVEPAAKPAAITKQPWPATLPEQVAAVARLLADAAAPLSEADLAARFTGKGPWKKRLPQLLETLAALGRARAVEGGWLG